MADEPQEDVSKKKGVKPPSIKATAFKCPHCGTPTTQYWSETFIKRLDDGETPFHPNAEMASNIENNHELDEDTKRSALEFLRRSLTGNVFFDSSTKTLYNPNAARNLYLSLCYECEEVSVWVGQKLAWPPTRTGPEPNADLPDAVKADYEEARAILDLSARGSAALLRLAIEKLCIELKAEGDNLNQRIGYLVSERKIGERVQKALDAVRVIGNEAVHPGTMDLKDDRATAEALFALVNVIAEKTISEEKHVQAVYDLLPPGKIKGIEQRDGKKDRDDT